MEYGREIDVKQLLGRLAVFAAAWGVSLATGCSSENPSPRYQVSGMVTYAGEPIPEGLVKFEPDVENGGMGPGGYAPIKDGFYRTEQGICAGPVKVSICGFDGVPLEVVKDGQTVFEMSEPFKEYPTTAEIKSEDTVIDFDVPQL
ncbi:hypothetical protein AB1K70_17310 [Bremerella sp. JC770]|uniref:hypothetical protein n=1 Tax=Bremerella sp. JC770 TaxID=3232137 RepID=UPI00345A29BF